MQHQHFAALTCDTIPNSSYLTFTYRFRFPFFLSVCVIVVYRPFKGYPELLLTCVRVLAKLSLLEPFRAQINSKPVYVKCLVDAIITESMMCVRVMNELSEEKSSKGQNIYISSLFFLCFSFSCSFVFRWSLCFCFD